MARILLIMFDKEMSSKITRELRADGHFVDHVVGILRLFESHFKAINSYKSAEIVVQVQSYDLAILCTTSRHVSNYDPGEVASWLHRNKVPCVSVLQPTEELEMRFANTMFGIESSEHLTRALIYGEKSVACALRMASQIEWTDVPPISDDYRASFFSMLRTA